MKEVLEVLGDKFERDKYLIEVLQKDPKEIEQIAYELKALAFSEETTPTQMQQLFGMSMCLFLLTENKGEALVLIMDITHSIDSLLGLCVMNLFQNTKLTKEEFIEDFRKHTQGSTTEV